MKNKKVKQMMKDVFNGEWETLEDGSHKLIILEGYFGSWPVHCALHRMVSIDAEDLRLINGK